MMVPICHVLGLDQMSGKGSGKEQENMINILPKLMQCPLPPKFQINVNFETTWAVDDKISLSVTRKEQVDAMSLALAFCCI